MQIRKQAENYYCNYFCLSGLLNYPSNKVIQIKSFFYNNLLRQLSFPTNIGNYINSQTNLTHIHHNFISQLLLSLLYLPSIRMYYNMYGKLF